MVLIIASWPSPDPGAIPGVLWPGEARKSGRGGGDWGRAGHRAGGHSGVYTVCDVMRYQVNQLASPRVIKTHLAVEMLPKQVLFGRIILFLKNPYFPTICLKNRTTSKFLWISDFVNCFFVHKSQHRLDPD